MGFEDETRWSRLAQPSLATWTDPAQPVRWVEKARAADDPDPKALACYGLLVRWYAPDAVHERLWLRFVAGRPVSALTIQCLTWCCQQAAAVGKRALLLVWDNASWHISPAVRHWLRAHNREVKRTGHGVRLLVAPLPTKSPWLNPIEPKWAHGKRQVAEPDRILTAQETMERVCATFECPLVEPLALPK